MQEWWFTDKSISGDFQGKAKRRLHVSNRNKDY